MPRGPIEKSRSTITAPTFTGQAKFADGSAAAPSITFASDTDTGWYRSAADTMSLSLAGAQRYQFDGNATLQIVSSTASLSLNGDVVLTRDAANTPALRNSTNAQTLRVYKTFTDASNYERLDIIAANPFTIQTTQAGTGTARGLSIGTVGSAAIDFFVNNSNRWQISTSGHLLTASDNNYDIGASGATRPRTIYAGTSIVSAGAITTSTVTSRIGYSHGTPSTVTQLTSKSTGVTLNAAVGQITMNNAALAADTTVSFVCSNGSVAANDVIVVNHWSGGTAGSYTVNAQAGSNQITFNVRNITGGSLSEAIVLNFVVIRGS